MRAMFTQVVPRTILVIVVLAATLSGQQPERIVISNVTLIDGTGKPALQGTQVVISNGRIESITRSPAPAPGGATVIDGTGRFLIPGLWDAHLHLADVGEVAIPALLAYGVTSVRDAGGDPATLRRWRSRTDSGAMTGPRITFCGPMLEGKWDPASVGGRTDHWVVGTTVEARAMVDRLAALDVDCIKVRSFASPDVFFAIAAAAREKRLPLAAHPLGSIDPVAAASAGVGTIEHAFYPWPWDTLPAFRKKQIADAFRTSGSLVVPTLIAWETFRSTPQAIAATVDGVATAADARAKLVSPALHRNWTFGVDDFRSQNSGSPGWHRAIDQVYEQVAELHEQGVGVMTGTDTGVALVYPGSSLHRELELLVDRCRFTPMDALLSATANPARHMGLFADLGTIEAGKLADAVLLSADPLADIRNLRSIVGVLSRGRWHDRRALDAILSSVEKAIAQARSK